MTLLALVASQVQPPIHHQKRPVIIHRPFLLAFFVGLCAARAFVCLCFVGLMWLLTSQPGRRVIQERVTNSNSDQKGALNWPADRAWYQKALQERHKKGAQGAPKKIKR